jgi:aspartyl-tRNA(Asn)/glutamyl-tRNA(Gln) amidotransferase subunit C
MSTVYTQASDRDAEDATEQSETMTERVSATDVERVAELAHLELAPAEIPAMVKDLNAILDYVAELSELDTQGVAPLAQVGELEGTDGASALRADTIQPSLQRAVVMAEAPESDGAFFKVPKVIER